MDAVFRPSSDSLFSASASEDLMKGSPVNPIVMEKEEEIENSTLHPQSLNDRRSLPGCLQVTPLETEKKILIMLIKVCASKYYCVCKLMRKSV